MSMRQKLRKLLIEKTEDTKIQLFRSTQSSQYSYLVDLGLYILMVEVLSVPYLIARFIAYMIGTTMSYFLSVLWIFPTRNVDNRFVEYGGFASIGLMGAGANMILMAFLKEILGFYHIYANITAGITVFIFSFTVRKILLFTKKQKV